MAYDKTKGGHLLIIKRFRFEQSQHVLYMMGNLSNNCNHRRNLVGDTGDVSPHFFR